MKKRIIALIISLVFIFSAVGFAEEVVGVKQGIDTTLTLIDSLGITDRSQYDILKSTILRLAAEDKEALHKVLNAMAKSVDNNSAYYSDEEWKEMQSSLTGVNGGIGIIGLVEGDYLVVTSVIDGGAAKIAGIINSDKIIEVDGVDVTGNNANVATKYLKGEIGTKVNLKVLRNEKEIIEYNLIRTEIMEKTVTSSILENDIGYIGISSFSLKTGEECTEVFNTFVNKKIKNVIIDLRNNGGGVVDSALQISSSLLDKGDTIITTKAKDPEDKTTYVSETDAYDFNIVLLVNENTASASEILTAALVENEKAVSIGVTTYGKATMQQFFPLGQVGGVLKITTKQYFTPKENQIHKVGIVPTYTVENRVFQYDVENLPKLSYWQKLDIGAVHSDVKSVEQMLKMLHYPIDEPDETYDIKTKNAIIAFQRAQGLYAYGVCDITTQNHLVNKILESKFFDDNQLEAAIDYFKKV